MKLEGLKKRKWILLSAFFLFWLPTLSTALEYPTKPINLLIASNIGGTMDISIRVLAAKAEKFLGQPFVISINTGGAGTVAVGIVAKQKPDGYNLVSSFSTPIILIPHYRPVPYEFGDLIPVMHFGAAQSGLVVRADSPWKTLKEFIEYAKKNPSKITYAIAATGQPMHLAMEFIAKQEGGIQWTAIPTTGVFPSISLLGGHVTAASDGTSWVPYVKEGKLRLLITHGEKRMKTFPDVPTMRELGYDFINEAVYMISVPKGTPPPIVKKLDEAFRKGMDDPEFIQTLDKMEIAITYRNPEDTKEFLGKAYTRLGKMVQELKMPREPGKK